MRPCVFVSVCECVCKCVRACGRVYMSLCVRVCVWICWDFVARAQDFESTNQIAAMRKLNINSFPPRPLMTIKQGGEKFFSKLELA